jgi:hypothetical protein
VTEAVSCSTTDGLTLEAEYAPALGPPRAAAVLCHPHPTYGGTMRSLVISALFSALPGLGVACLRFNFRGVEGSEGTYTSGADEPRDALAAIETLSAEVPDLPLTLIGWSFGADIALSVDDARIVGWIAIAAPLRFRSGFAAVGADPRPKLILLAGNDEFRAPTEVEAEVAGWTNTRVETIAGASHFFVGRTDRLVELVGGWFDALGGLQDQR